MHTITKVQNLIEEQRLHNTIDKLLRVERTKEFGKICGCITILAVSIGRGAAGLPISSIALMAFAAR
ncbi:hypothetical protein IHO40_01760 [Wolbachia endosymbiont of Mansonella ozzardi]|uniref:hypothetical protein n=1 Tax=Wolbachia endosymbiont of Mansonella ozzardi TaxID=137464 RepID=UPI001CE0A2F9|nr:hypothetical protein [Wolbachia endosymbiont of Mansonella ozzardi]MCA4774881.1 hypothetical protein [Wolbachia endosymbiont of Mansonella ozzardi]